MKVCFNGIGQQVVTFIDGGVTKGKVCKISGSGKVGPCSAKDGVAGLVLHADGSFADVQIGGYVTLSYTGTAPTLGWCSLSADASGGVAADSAGRSFLVVEVDTTAKTVGMFI